jgi:methylated-DNA-protein-cysteine methyltransferase-like protein
VGYALAALDVDSGIPWHRVVNAAGRISARDTPGGRRQRELLEDEGISFQLGGQIDLAIFRWSP